MRLFRKERIESLLEKEISAIISRDFNFGGALATITQVEVRDNLESARIGVSVIPSAQSAAVLKILKNAEPEFNFKLKRKINIKPLPRINFILDRGPESAARVEKLLLNE